MEDNKIKFEAVTKKPWLKEWFPKGTLVEVKDFSKDQRKETVVAEVCSAQMIHYRNLVLGLVVQATGEKYFADATYVERIISRGDERRGYGDKCDNEPIFATRGKKNKARFNRHAESWKKRKDEVVINRFDRYLKRGRLFSFELRQAIDAYAREHGLLLSPCHAVDVFMRTHPYDARSIYFGKTTTPTFSAKKLKKWLKRNQSRLIISERSREIASHWDYASDCMADDEPDHSSRSRVDELRLLESILNPGHLFGRYEHRSVLSVEEVLRYLKHGVDVFEVCVCLKGREDLKVVFFTDNPNASDLLNGSDDLSDWLSVSQSKVGKEGFSPDHQASERVNSIFGLVSAICDMEVRANYEAVEDRVQDDWDDAYNVSEDMCGD